MAIISVLWSNGHISSVIYHDSPNQVKESCWKSPDLSPWCTTALVRRRRSWDELRRTYHGAPFATKSKYKNVNTNTNTHKFIWAHTNVYKYEYKYTHLIHAKPTRLNWSGGWWWQRWWQLSPGTRVRRQSCRDRGAHRAVLALSRYLPSCWNTVVPSWSSDEHPAAACCYREPKVFAPIQGAAAAGLGCLVWEVKLDFSAGAFSSAGVSQWWWNGVGQLLSCDIEPRATRGLDQLDQGELLNINFIPSSATHKSQELCEN